VASERGPAWWHGEAGNTLLLFPAAVLILLGLGGMAIDAATLFLGQRRMVDLATAVATDAVAGIQEAAFYDAAAVEVDPRRAAARRDQLVAAVEDSWSLRDVGCTVAVAGDQTTAECAATVRPLLAPLWWRDGASRRVVGAETARGLQR
jgi:Flp pilus assembly protein TadG